jgi:hypothetical protein
MAETQTFEKNELDRLPIVGSQPKDEREEKYLREICEYEFINIEDPRISIKFPYGSTRYSKNFTFFHGGKYSVPRHVARHVESRATPQWSWRPNGLGGMEKQRVGDKPRFQMRQVYS